MNYVDIAIIAIIAFFALIGLWKGFGKTFIKLFCFALALLATWLVVDSVINWVLNVELIRNFIVGDGWSLYGLYYNSFGEEILGAAEGTQLSGAMGLYINPMIERFTAMGGPTSYGLTYAQFIAVNLSVNTLSIILCVLLYAVARIVAIIIAWILKKIIVRGEVRAWSRLVGFIFGAVRGATVVAVLLIISTVIFPLSFAQPYTQTVGDGIIGKFAAQYTYKAFDAAIYGTGTEKTEKLLESAGYTKGDYPSEEEKALADAKAAAVNELTSYRLTKSDDNYTQSGVEKLEAAKADGIAAINNATTADEVAAALSQAKSSLDSVMTAAQEQALNDARAEKSGALRTLRDNKIGTGEYTDDSLYSKANFDKINTYYANGVTEIMAAGSVEEVNAAYDAAVKSINETPTKIDELRKEKLTALSAEYLSRNGAEGLTEEQKAALLSAYDEGKAAVSAAVTEQEINEAYEAAVSAMNGVTA